MIDKQAKLPDAAWTVLRGLVSTDSAALRAEQAKRQPPRTSATGVWEKVFQGKTARLGRVMADTARPDARAFWKDANEVGSIVGKYMDATLFKNELPVPQAMRAAMDEVRGYYAGAK